MSIFMKIVSISELSLFIDEKSYAFFEIDLAYQVF